MTRWEKLRTDKDKLALEAFQIVASTDRRSRATVRISRGGRDHIEAEAEGNGPMDALFRATDAAVGVRGEVTGLRIYAFDDYGMVGRARITVNFEGGITRDEDRVPMRSTHRLAPTCARSPITCRMSFRGSAWSEPLRTLVKEAPTSSWSNAGNDVEGRGSYFD